MGDSRTVLKTGAEKIQKETKKQGQAGKKERFPACPIIASGPYYKEGAYYKSQNISFLVGFTF